jgi:signal transduction histidine kinase
MSTLLAAHENAFAHFGGRCQYLLYDQMRTVLLGSVDADGRRRHRLNPTMSRGSLCDGAAEISVTDGIGIPAEDLTTVFEEFRQAATCDDDRRHRP